MNNPFGLRQSELAELNNSVHGFRKVLVILAIVGLVYMGTADAAFLAYEPEQLVEESDVIVKAEMIGTSQIIVANDHVILLGVLRVDEVIKGEVIGDVILLRLPGPEVAMRSDLITHKKGQNGWWFLNGADKSSLQGIYTADHPQRFSDDQSTAEWLAKLIDS